MIIYGHSGQDIRRAMWSRRYRFLSVIAVIGLLVCLTGCGTAKQNSMGEFFKAIGSGDISVIKEKFKGAEDKEDGSWDSIEEKVE
tara:strand:- start:303 stop:557 length:255 start_codon:yes stop_codon:yes gene_type:complete